MRSSLLCMVVVVVASATHAAWADDVTKAEGKLAKAREAHAASLAGIRDDVLKQIDGKDAAERKRTNPDLATLKSLKAEREALEKNGEMPKWIDIKTKDRISTARKPLLDALVETKAAYVRAKEDDKAAVVGKEIDLIKQGNGLAVPMVVPKKSFAGLYKDRFGREVTLTSDGLAKRQIDVTETVVGKWAEKDGRCEVKWQSGWTDRLALDKNGKDLIGEQVAPKGKSSEMKYEAIPPKK